MSLLKGQLRSWSGGGLFDPFGLTGKVLPKGVDSFVQKGPLGNAGGMKEFAGTKIGSLHSGRAILQGGPKEQNMESARTFDLFGSPATAGTKQQSSARAAAIIYGLIAGAGAMGAGGAGGGGVGFGGTTSASSAPSATAGSSNPFVTNVGYSGSAVGSGTGTAAGTSSSPGFQDYARMGNSMMQQGQPQGQQSQPLQHQYVGQPYRNPYMMGYPWS